MFKPAAMVYLRAIVLARDERNVLRTLGGLGVMQLTRSPTSQSGAPFVSRDVSSELARCRRVLARAQELRKSLARPNWPAPIAVPPETTLAAAEDRLLMLETAVDAQLKRRRPLRERFDELEKTSGRLAGYRGLEVPLDPAEETSFLHFVTGRLPPENVAKLQSEIGDNIALLPLPQPHGLQPLLIVCGRHSRPDLENRLQQAGFQPDVLPDMPGGTSDTWLKDSEREQAEIGKQLNEIEAELFSLANKSDQSLTEVEMVAETELRLLEAGQNFARTDSAIFLTGWLPLNDAQWLKVRLQEITGGRCVLEWETPQDGSGREVPILLQHPFWLRPFEKLVTAYELPLYRDLEPTLFVAISYLLMFGVMFGDVGHGMMLTVAGLIVAWQRRDAKARDVGWLLLFAGLASLFFGFVYGSFFGIPSFKRLAFWHDPLEVDPMKLMSGSIGLGVIMISLGVCLNIINRWRHRDHLGALLGRFGVVGAVFYWGSLLLLTQYPSIEAHGLMVPVVIAFLIVPVLAWVLKEPIEFLIQWRVGKAVAPDGGWFASMSESFVGAFEVILSFFANTVSFVRLAAYAMSHAALLMATFLMAEAVKHISPAGGLWSVLVMILGNAVVILLEGVVASVQALRLEYYEFFGKFFAGGGQPFKPFRLQTKSVTNSPL